MIFDRNSFFSTFKTSKIQRKGSSLLIGHSPATEVRKIVRQNPNLASDFMVIRAMAVGRIPFRVSPSNYFGPPLLSRLVLKKTLPFFFSFPLPSPPTRSLELIPPVVKHMDKNRCHGAGGGVPPPCCCRDRRACVCACVCAR